jgi:hypothetical protein
LYVLLGVGGFLLAVGLIFCACKYKSGKREADDFEQVKAKRKAKGGVQDSGSGASDDIEKVLARIAQREALRKFQSGQLG